MAVFPHYKYAPMVVEKVVALASDKADCSYKGYIVELSKILQYSRVYILIITVKYG